MVVEDDFRWWGMSINHETAELLLVAAAVTAATLDG